MPAPFRMLITECSDSGVMNFEDILPLATMAAIDSTTEDCGVMG